METNKAQEAGMAAHRRYFDSGATRSRKVRAEALRKLQEAMERYTQPLCEALFADLHKSPSEAYLTEIMGVRQEIRTFRRHLRGWMREKRYATPWMLLTSHSRIRPEPLGVVLVVAPWNYPVQLLLLPLIGAVAAGNCVVLKSSPLAPHTEKVLSALIREVFPPEWVSFVSGEVEQLEQLLTLRFDSIFFTGGSGFGHKVMQAAARYLTPVTLELGGKSPCIVGRQADVALAARRIAWGKWMNAGQTCVAPDYLWVHQSLKATLCSEIEQVLVAFYGKNLRESPSYPRMVSQQAAQRMERLIHGSGTILWGGEVVVEERFVAPTLIDEPDEQSPIMQEEIFGPLLPVKAFSEIEEVLSAVRSREKPLALYYFGDSQEAEQVLAETSSGGVCINDTLAHVANLHLPFGGVGQSGMGRYHGRQSFELFSNPRAIVRTATWLDVPLRYPPYPSMQWLKRWLG
ncbi:MAG: aldehyde dehydrogenase family protein [Alistipes sp.]|nr:aldehyde dehydrogenase family protein [Alistipes sp.]